MALAGGTSCTLFSAVSGQDETRENKQQGNSQDHQAVCGPAVLAQLLNL